MLDEIDKFAVFGIGERLHERALLVVAHEPLVARTALGRRALAADRVCDLLPVGVGVWVGQRALHERLRQFLNGQDIQSTFKCEHQ